MPNLGVKVVLEAEDRARGVLDQFGRTVVDLSQKTETGLVRMETAMSRTALGVRRLAVPMVAELVPAMDTTVGRMASVVTGAVTLSSGFGAVALAAAGLAGILGGALLQHWRESTKQAEDFQRIINSTDVGAMTSKIRDLSGALEELGNKGAQLRDIESALRALGLGATPTFPWEQSGSDQNLERRKQTINEILALMRKEEELRHGAALEAEFGQVDVERGRRFTEALKEAKRLQEQLLQLREQARAADIGAMRSELIEFEGIPEVALDRARELLRLREEAAHLDEQAATRQPSELVEFEGLGRAQTDLLKSRAAQKEAADAGQRLVDIERERLAITRQLGPIVTQADAESSRLVEIELDRRRQLVGVTDDHKMALINLGAEYEREIVRQEQLRRTDPSVGMLAGIETLAEEWASLGRVMERGALDFGATLQSSLAKALRGEDAGRSFWEGFKRIGTELVSQWIVGTLFRSFLPGGAGLPLGSLVGAGVDVTGASPAALAGLVSQNYSLVAGAGGRTFAIPGGGSRFAQAAGSRGLIDPLTGLPADPNELALGGPSYSATADLYGYGTSMRLASGPTFNAVGEPEYLGLPTAASPQGLGAGNYAAAGLSATAGALALYGYYQANRRTGGGPGGAIGLAATGALTGAAAASALGLAAGAGAGVGAFAAFAVIALTESRAAHKRRNLGDRQARIQGSAQLYQELAAAVQAIVTDDNALRRQLSSGNTAGGLLLGLALLMGNSELARFLDLQGVTPEGFGGIFKVGSLEEFIASANRSGGDIAGLLEQALVTLKGIQASEEAATFGYQEYDPRSLVSRTTYRPFTQLGTIAQDTQNLFASAAQMRRAGVTDAPLQERLWRNLLANSMRRDIRFDLDEPSMLGVE